MKRVDIEFVRRAALALVNGIALGDTVQMRGAAVALAKELSIPQPDFDKSSVTRLAKDRGFSSWVLCDSELTRARLVVRPRRVRPIAG
jgi:hypothetical protein